MLPLAIIYNWSVFIFVIAAINKSTIIRNGLLEPLINLLTMSSLDVQCNACGCITTLATTGIVCVWCS